MMRLKILTSKLVLRFSNVNQKAEYYFNRGIDKKNLLDYNGAIAEFAKAIELKSTIDKFYATRAACKESIYDFKGAISDYTIAILLNPSSSIHYSDRARCKNNLEDFFGSIIDCNKAIELNFNNVDAYVERSKNKADLRDFSGAIIDQKKAIEIEPKVVSNEINLNKSRLTAHQVALESYIKSLELEKKHATSYLLSNREICKSYLNKNEKTNQVFRNVNYLYFEKQIETLEKS